MILILVMSVTPVCLVDVVILPTLSHTCKEEKVYFFTIPTKKMDLRYMINMSGQTFRLVLRRSRESRPDGPAGVTGSPNFP